jgi:hypothetical protein
MREAGWYLFLVEASHRDEATMGDDTCGNHAISKLPSSSSPLFDRHRLQLGDKLIELAITEPSGLAIELAAFDKLE